MNPTRLLQTALANQYSGIGSPKTVNDYLNELQSSNPILYASIQSGISIMGAQAEASLYPINFAGRTLRLSHKEIVNGTYVYAVVDTPTQAFLDATDY